jgi:uncharacterized membrane protein
MMTAPTDVLVSEYLRAVERALVGLPVARRAELLADLREHIAEERALLDPETEAGVRSILERLGDPDAVAAEARVEGMPPLPLPPPVQLSPGPRVTAVGWVIAVLLMVCALCITGVVLGLVLFRAGTGAGVKQHPVPPSVRPTQSAELSTSPSPSPRVS